MKTKFILLSLFSMALTALTAEAKILRSAALYYTPDQMMEVNTTMSYTSLERNNSLFITKGAYSTIGAQFEHGLTEHISWGSNFKYGNGSTDIQITAANNKSESSNGLFDPEFLLKSHFETESFRFHVNGIFSAKSDVKHLAYDQTPLNFSSGGSALALALAGEAAAGPTLLGVELRGDLWRDTQEIVERSSSGLETIYMRDGSKQLSLAAFGELNNFKSVKPGLKIQTGQIGASNSERQANQPTTATTLSSYKLPTENQLVGSLYARIRLPSHFVLNCELFAKDSYYDNSNNSNSSTPHNKTYGISSNIGFKF
jgi:hypothetical protein